MTARAILSVTGASVSYSGVRALDGVDISASAGEIVGVIGPNGAGKSTLVNLIAGVVRGTGDVILADLPLRGMSPQDRARAGVVRTFQTPELFGTMTALENVQLAATARERRAPRTDRQPRRRGRAATARTHADAALRDVGLDARRGTRVASMSGGERKLLELARALVQQPSVLLLDEPVAGLPLDARTNTIDLIRSVIKKTESACVLIEHDMEVVSSACDRVYVLSRGVLIKEGSWDEASSDPVVREAYLGSSFNANKTK